MSKGRRASERRKSQQPAKEIAEALSETLTGRTTLDLDDVTIGTVGNRDLASQMEQEGRPRANPQDYSATRAFAKAVAEGTGGPESTQVLALPEKAPREGARLTLISGAKAGARIDVVRSPFNVGRQEDLDLTLYDDKKISRVHFRLLFTDRRRTWSIEDLESTSGTLLNGVPLEGKSQIRHGDVIIFGETELRFTGIEDLPRVDDAAIVPIAIGKEPAPPAPERSMAMALAPFKEFTKAAMAAPAEGERFNKKKVILIVLLLLFFLSVGIAGIVTAIYVLPHGPSAKELQKADALIDEAEGALKAFDLEKAEQKVEEGLEIAPQHARGLSLQKLLLTEKQVKAALDEASASLIAGNLDLAAKALLRIPDSSIFRKQRDVLRQKVLRGQLNFELDGIEVLIDEGKLDEARKELEEFLQKHPDHARAQQLRSRLGKGGKAKLTQPAGVMRAQAAFAVGNVEQARVLARVDADRGQKAAQRYLSKLATFMREKKAGEKALARKKAAQALPSLEEAYRLVPYLSGHRQNAVHKQKVGHQLGDALFLSAMLQKSGGEECKAAAQLRRAAKIAPKSRKVRQQIGQFKTKAENALRRAESFAESRPKRAKALAKEALCWVSSSSKLHRKLKRLSR